MSQADWWCFCCACTSHTPSPCPFLILLVQGLLPYTSPTTKLYRKLNEATEPSPGSLSWPPFLVFYPHPLFHSTLWTLTAHTFCVLDNICHMFTSLNCKLPEGREYCFHLCKPMYGTYLPLFADLTELEGRDWCFWTVALEKTLERPLDYKEIQPVQPKGNQSWIFIGRTDAEAEAPILWPPDAKN